MKKSCTYEQFKSFFNELYALGGLKHLKLTAENATHDNITAFSFHTTISDYTYNKNCLRLFTTDNIDKNYISICFNLNVDSITIDIIKQPNEDKDLGYFELNNIRFYCHAALAMGILLDASTPPQRIVQKREYVDIDKLIADAEDYHTDEYGLDRDFWASIDNMMEK